VCGLRRESNGTNSQGDEADVAIFHLAAQVIGRSRGQSAVAAAAYRAAARILDVRTGEVHDYTRKKGVREAFILAPDGAPAWMTDRAQLWNAVEKTEDELNRKRRVAQLARDVEVSLPHELTHDQRRQLLVEFLEEEFVSLGMVADVAMHAPGREGDRRNEHAHILLTLRHVDGNSFGQKDRSWNEDSLLEHWRENWAQRVNLALEANAISARVDHRSFERQALAAGHDLTLASLPTVHLGPNASALERRGIRTVPGDLNREVVVVNLELERARRQAKADAERPSEPTSAPLMRLPETLLPANKTRRPENQKAAPLMRLPTFPKPQPAAPNPSMDFARRLAERAPMPINAPKAKARVGGTTTSRPWTDADRQAWRRRLVERHYQVEIEDSLAAMLNFVDRQSVKNGLRLRLAGGGQLDDLGDQVQASGQDLRTECRATVALCKAKGWTAVVSSGPPEYLAMMREEAELAGLKFSVTGLPEADPEPSDDEPRPGLR